MEWNAARIWPKALGFALALVSAAGVLSFDLNDPTFTNLRAYSQGTGNWIGLPGALIGGSLVELFGAASLLAPVLILNWMLTAQGKIPLHRYLFWSLALMAAVASAHGLVVLSVTPGVLAAGLAGWCARYWSDLTTGPWWGGVLLTYFGLYAANQLTPHPALQVFKQAAAGAIPNVIRGLAQGITGAWGGVRNATAPPRPGQPAWSISAVLADTFLFWRGSSLRRIKARQERAELSPWTHPASEETAGNNAPPADDFDSWLTAIGASGVTGSLGATPATPRTSATDAEPGPLENHPPFVPPRRPPSPPVQAPFFDTREADTASEEASGEGDDRNARALPERDQPFAGSHDQDRFEANMRGMHPESSTEVSAQTGAKPPISPTAEDTAEFEQNLNAEDPLRDGPEGGAAAHAPIGETSFVFEQPTAETAWREQFQRYARNLDLDWEQVWAGRDATPEEEAHPGSPTEEEPV